MPIPITVPRLGWNMEEGTFVEWLKADGEDVRPGDLLFRLESEKSVEEIEAFDAGVLRISADGPKPGDVVRVGVTIGQLLQPTEGMQAEKTTPAISPRARRLSEKHNIDWAALRGSGRTGRIRERDVAATLPSQPNITSIPITPLRKTIAARMMASRHATAPVTLTTMADATNLVNLRDQFKAVAKTDGSPVPAYTDFLLKLVAFALQQHPQLSAQWTDDGIRLATRIDIGLAVETDAGLFVPVLRNVPALGLRPIAEQTRQLIDRARQGTLSVGDMAGGCFTITSLGAYGIEFFTPIINSPECAILGLGQIKRQPVMDGDRVVGRDQLPLSLTFDHRIVDGAPAARFLQTLTRLIESPGPWLAT